MKLSELNPIYRKNSDRDEYSLQFDCPVCGNPYRILIIVGLTMRESKECRVWKVSHLPDGPDWVNTVTITPSINNTTAGHGRKHPTCGFHGTIVNGEII
jgi:hypothetical protein